MDNFSYMSNGDVNAIDALYQQYLQDKTSVDSSWQKFFEGFDFARADFSEGGAIPENLQREFKVINLINGYRTRGHLFTRTNPVRERRKYSPTLALENFGLQDSDLEVVFQAGENVGIGPAPLKDIIAHLETTYCESIGAEYVYIRQPKKVQWLQQRMESTRNTPSFSSDAKRQILRKLNQAVAFESFLHTKFVGQKRFSLEGAETLIPALDAVIEVGADLGIKEFVMGMAHRGRLNVLSNIFNKTNAEIFSEFEGTEYEDSLFDGDVKYHLGYSCTITTDNGKEVEMVLSPNPSHLEAVDPVVEGIARAKIDQQYEGDNSKLAPILIHGDAAVAAQGVVYEVIQMSQLDGYKTGGTVHIVINNQIGFTTNYLDARSSTYCTDVGKVTLSPVFHVNGDDAEAVAHTIKLALEYRQEFKQDVFVDLLCYRKYGHNEGDEPRFTQPMLYKAIKAHPNPREIYLKQLIEEGVIKREEASEMDKEIKAYLQGHYDESKKLDKATITSFMRDEWEGIERARIDVAFDPVKTAVAKRTLKSIGDKITTAPDDKKFFKKLLRILDDRKKMLAEDRLDWGMAELLAYGTLLNEGHHIRFSGQDVERGTFSHRHAILKVEDSEEEYCTLNHISQKQGEMMIYNSLLSEYGVLGFEFGYSVATPQTLTIWEAQFGDFFNGAQIMVDQFISAAEDKWNIFSGLVMLLPHGYEGQGAEHSSARMERFLQQCADYNMECMNITTPGNFFHALRRQLKRNYRKPLVVFTPKKLLRYPKAVSSLDEMSKGGFKAVIDDPNANAAKVEKVVLCTGKFYYDILEQREAEGLDDNLAVVRVEQLYPLPEAEIRKVIEGYKNAKRIVWAQEEPSNMGAWTYMLSNLRDLNLEVAARHSSAAPASGSSKRYAQRQQAILDDVLDKNLVLNN